MPSILAVYGCMLNKVSYLFSPKPYTHIVCRGRRSGGHSGANVVVVMVSGGVCAVVVGRSQVI